MFLCLIGMSGVNGKILEPLYAAHCCCQSNCERPKSTSFSKDGSSVSESRIESHGIRLCCYTIYDI